MNSSLQKTLKQTFLQLIEDLKDKKEIDSVLEDLMENDYEKLIKKLAVVYWIRKKRPDDIIQNNLGVTDKYIKDVKKIMEKPGIKLAIKYMEAEEWANVWAKRIKNLSKK
ncbi:MAG: hypothetical protein ABSC49_00940 [Candidatus Microgenomates bacterium]|jgi:uncharacterized protein YerC